MARVRRDFAALLDEPAVTRINGVSLPGHPDTQRRAPGTVYRALLLRVLPDTDADTVARFEARVALDAALRAGDHGHGSSAVSMTRSGLRQWTHVFEQEFGDVDGLMGPYLMHPIHWAVVDRWFDPECPDVIIRDRVCHSFCRSPPLRADPDPVLAPIARRAGCSGWRWPAARSGGSIRRAVQAVHRQPLRPRIVQAERHQAGALGGGQMTHRQHRLGQVLHRLGREGRPESVVPHRACGPPSTGRRS